MSGIEFDVGSVWCMSGSTVPTGIVQTTVVVRVAALYDLEMLPSDEPGVNERSVVVFG
ncbi:hypothetical protein GCM10027268_12740 [Brachybacterium huguangmaarense]